MIDIVHLTLARIWETGSLSLAVGKLSRFSKLVNSLDGKLSRVVLNDVATL